MKIQAATNFQNVSEAQPKELPRFIDIFAQDVVNVVNGNLEFGTNVKTSLISAAFTSANTDATFNHSLGKVPTGYLVAGLSASMVVYAGSNASTNKTITLKSSAIGTASLLLF